MREIKLITILILITIIMVSCSLFIDEEDKYDDYTWDGTAYADADNDGIPDVAELEDTSFYGMPLYDWGARPGIPDLFIHIAPMEPGADPEYPSYPDGGMLLQKKALDRVVAAFSAQGIAVHFDVGKNGLYEGYNEITDRGKTTYNLSGKDHSFPYNDSIALKNYSGTNSTFTFVDNLREEYLPSKRNQIFYFMVLGSSQNADGSGGSSGIAWGEGRDFLITLAKWNLGFGTNPSLGLTYDNFENYVINTQASTIMHEFGHNLGLHHGGNVDMNYMPNYYSIMNYLYQLNGLPRIGVSEGDRYYYERYILEILNKTGNKETWSNLIDKQFTELYKFDLKDSPYSDTYRMDFSHGEGGALDEASLNEADGLRQTGSNYVDWDGDTVKETGISENINPSYKYYEAGILVSDPSSNTVMNDYNDWGNLSFYYNSHHVGAARTLNDTSLELQRETNSSSNIVPFQRSR